jgi:uncharacterized protein (DUF1778 family)
MSTAKTERLVVRVTHEDLRLLERAAQADHLDLTTYIRRAALQAARRWETDDRQPRREGD